MAQRYAIVYVNGLPRELPAADRLSNSGNVTRASSAPASPQAGDLWFDTTGDGTLKVYDGSSSWDDAVAGGTPYAPPPISENNQTISTSYSITANKNGVSVGPITVSNNVVVTVPDGAVWATL
jgi:hypothetical protein